MTETGIMDRTHLRFFDFLTARQLLENAGLEVEQRFGIGYFPMGPLSEWYLSLSAGGRFVSRYYLGLFAFHLIVFGCLSAAE